MWVCDLENNANSGVGNHSAVYLEGLDVGANVIHNVCFKCR